MTPDFSQRLSVEEEAGPVLVSCCETRMTMGVDEVVEVVGAFYPCIPQA